MNKFIAIILCVLFCVEAHTAERPINIEFDLPAAPDVSGQFVINEEQFSKFNAYFKNVNSIEKADIPYDLDVGKAVAATIANNDIAFVSMNDSCLVKPGAGISHIAIDGLQDCVGLFIYQPQIGSAGAHVTIGTKLSSLDCFLNPFQGYMDTQITLMTSWKTNLLKHVLKHIGSRKLSITSLYVNNVIQQTNTDGTRMKRYASPNDFPNHQELLRRLTNRQTLQDVGLLQSILENKSSSPLGAVMNVNTGVVSFPGKISGENYPHISNGIIKSTREYMLGVPCWLSIRYKKDVKPKEKEMDVDIAFVQYPINQ